MSEESVTEGQVDAREMFVDYSDLKVRYISIPVPNWVHKVITTIVAEYTKKTGTELTMDRFVRDTLIRGVEEFALPMMGIVLRDKELEKMEASLRGDNDSQK